MKENMSGYELPYEFLVDFQDKLRLSEEKFRNIEDVAVKVNGLLKELSLFYEADRAFVMEIDWDLGIGFISYRYHVQGIWQADQEILSIPMERFAGWVNKLRANQPVIIDVEKMMREYPEQYDQNYWQDIKYLLAAPFSKHLNTGIVGIGNPKKYRQNLSFLSVLAAMIVSDLNEIKLQERVDIVVRRFSQCATTEVYISCFGGMEIRGSKGILTDENITADQCYRLLAFLLFHRKKTKPIRELADIVWNDTPISNPYHDVKNVVYRLKRILSIIELEDLIIGASGTFVINTKYQIYTDFERFEEVCSRFFTTREPVLQESLFQTAKGLYKGTLLPKCDHVHWFLPRIGYYQTMYLKLLKEYILQRLSAKDYLSAQKNALDGLEAEPYDTDFMAYQIVCMFCQGNRSLARSYYSKVEADLTEEQKLFIQRSWTER